jgi:LysR family nitrogen assimilation transcriptional regulator
MYDSRKIDWIDCGTMDTRRLKSFIVIVDSGSITRAADILHVAQPP